MPDPVCKVCSAKLGMLANKNGGHYVGCPNKANHPGAAALKPAKPEPAAKSEPSPKPAPVPVPEKKERWIDGIL